VLCRPCQVAAGIAALEGAGLIAYAGLDVVVALRDGLTGPAAVSNLPGFFLQVLIFLILGGGMLAIARGWWMRARWARSPFVLAQLLALVVGVPIIGTGGLAGVIGIALVVLSVVGVAMVFSSSARAALDET